MRLSLEAAPKGPLQQIFVFLPSEAWCRRTQGNTSRSRGPAPRSRNRTNTLQYSDNSQNSLSSHGLDEEGSRSVCLSDHILRSEQSIYRLVWAWKEAAFGWSPSLIDTTLWSWEVGRQDNMSTPLPNTATTQTQPQNTLPVLKGALIICIEFSILVLSATLVLYL